MNKNIISLVASVVAIVLSLTAISVAKGHQSFGAYVTGAGVSNFDIVDAALGFRVNGNLVINSSGNFTGVINTASSSRQASPVATGSKVILTGNNATTSVTAAQICATSYFEWSPSVANATATLPSASSLGSACLTTTGDRIQPIVWKNTSASASSTIFAAGASTTLVYVNASTTANGAESVLLGGGYDSLQFLVTSSTDPTSGITVLINQFK